jgi:hypothetical protein
MFNDNDNQLIMMLCLCTLRMLITGASAYHINVVHNHCSHASRVHAAYWRSYILLISDLYKHVTYRLGLGPFIAAYRYLKKVGNSHEVGNNTTTNFNDDAAATDELEMLMGGTDQLAHLPVLLQLIAVEERFDEM